MTIRFSEEQINSVVPKNWKLRDFEVANGIREDDEWVVRWGIQKDDQVYFAAFSFTGKQMKQENYIPTLLNRVKWAFEHTVDPGKHDREIEEIKKELELYDQLSAD